MHPDKISHYKILEKLGAGGMGVVYLAEDTKLGRKVAIKILSDEFTTNKDRLHRFEQEASAASNLNHPNILTIHEVGVDDGRHYIATEFIDGLTLRRKIAAKLEVREILDIAIQVASALEEAHSAGIVHRDIKPDNIMVRRNGYVKVLDFGLAKLTEPVDRSPADTEASTRVLVQTDAGVVMGTAHYMSPEQARGKPVDARSDIWSLGVVIYEMVAGRTPFEGETSTDVVIAITQKEPQPLARFASNVPAELDWIVMKALRKDRDERYQTIRELITDLRRVKQRLEFEFELERSGAPSSVRSGISEPPPAPTTPETAAPTTEKTTTHVSSAEYIASGIKHHKIAAAIVALLLVAATASAIYLYSRNSQPLTERDTVLLTDFVNSTGEPVFDGTLKQALAVHLGQSPFLNLFPDDRVRETLRFMGRPPDDRITREVGREICERQGIKAMLTGTIASIGSNYVITLEALNPRSGNSIAREQIEAESKEKVLSSLGIAASNLRKQLGESLSSIEKFDVNIEQATTSSLDALKAFTMGVEARNKGKAEALVHFQRAVELDPNFAIAYVRIGMQYGNLNQPDAAAQWVQKAYDLRERVSERERLYITQAYYSNVTFEDNKAIETLQTWTRVYPNDFVAHNNLSVSYRFLGRYEEALKEALEAVRVSPNVISGRENVVSAFMGLGRFDEAEQAARVVLKINPEATSAHLTNYALAVLVRRDQAAIDREVQWAKGKPQEANLTAVLAATAMYFGKPNESEQLYKRAAEMFKSQNRNENASNALQNLALNSWFLGKCQQAKDNAKASLNLFRGLISIGGAAVIYAACNDAGQAQSLLDELRRTNPKNTLVASIFVPIVRASIETERGNVVQAIQSLEGLRSYESGAVLGLTTHYVRGNLYLQQRMGNEATAEFKRIIESPGINIYSPIHTLAHLGLGRAAVLNGDTVAARKSYQDFFGLWKDANPDLPVLVQARKEYEQLK